MKKSIVVLALLLPVVAHAERLLSEGTANLIGWYTLLTLSLLIFLVFGSSWWLQKLCALFGFVLATIVVWSWVMKTTISADRWVELSKHLVVGASPVVGFAIGFHLTRRNVVASLIARTKARLSKGTRKGY